MEINSKIIILGFVILLILACLTVAFNQIINSECSCKEKSKQNKKLIILCLIITILVACCSCLYLVLDLNEKPSQSLPSLTETSEII